MLTLTSKLQYDKCRKEINQLQFEDICIGNRKEAISNRLGQVRNDGKNAGWSDQEIEEYIASDDYYRGLAAEEDALDTRAASIDSELALLKEEMDNFEKLHQQGIQESTTFWCFGG